MKRSRIPSFRGLRALIEHPAGADRSVLQSQLQRLGLVVAVTEEVDRRPGLDADVYFFDADRVDGPPGDDGAAPPHAMPTIALIGSEAPSRLELLLARQPSAYLVKPIRRTGVYSCLAIAMHQFALLRRTHLRLEAAEQRVRGRRKVAAALVRLMCQESLNEDAAYRLLQRAAMSRRLSIEALSAELVANRCSLAELLAGVDGYRRSETG